MTKDETLRFALDTLKEVREETFRLMRNGERLYAEEKVYETIYAIKEVLAQPEQDNAYTYASNLAKTLWQKHYMKESPKFALLDTTKGVLTQIDNMTCGLVRETAQPMQEPVAWEQFHEYMAGPNYVAPQSTWVGLTDEEIDQGLLRSPYALQSAVAWRDGVAWAMQQLKDKNNV